LNIKISSTQIPIQISGREIEDAIKKHYGKSYLVALGYHLELNA